MAEASLDRIRRTCVQAAGAGAQVLLRTRPSAPRQKENRHSVVTDQDVRSQRAVLRQLERHADEGQLFLTEEPLATPRLEHRRLRSDRLAMLASSDAMVVDELDGTSSYVSGHHEWSVSVGFVRGLNPIAGAVVAPAIDGGLVFSGARGNGASLARGSGSAAQLRVRRNVPLSDAYICVGPEAIRPVWPAHVALVGRLAEATRTVNICGSCALGLGLVAAGRIDLLVQPPQWSWDWAAGSVLVEEAGGTIRYYSMERGRPQTIEKFEPRHFGSHKKIVGFVAGDAALVREVYAMLVRVAAGRHKRAKR